MSAFWFLQTLTLFAALFTSDILQTRWISLVLSLIYPTLPLFPLVPPWSAKQFLRLTCWMFPRELWEEGIAQLDFKGKHWSSEYHWRLPSGNGSNQQQTHESSNESLFCKYFFRTKQNFSGSGSCGPFIGFLANLQMTFHWHTSGTCA